MRRSLKLALDEFGRATLEGEAARYSVSPGELVGNAVKYYLSDLDSGRPALKVPRFARAASSPELDVEVNIDDSAGLKSASELLSFHRSVQVLRRPLATSSITWKRSQPVCSTVASPVAMRPASTSIRSCQRRARSL